MGDIIIIAVIAIAVFLILRSQIRRLRKGKCSGGCAGCNGSCCGCVRSHTEEAGK